MPSARAGVTSALTRTRGLFVLGGKLSSLLAIGTSICGCLAGVGLTLDLRALARSGWRPLVVAALGLVVVAGCSLSLVLLTSGAIGPKP